MELNVIESDKNRLKMGIAGEGHTFCNALSNELWLDDAMEIAGYNIKHALTSEPILTVQTSKGEAKKVLLQAVERLKKRNKEFKTAFNKF